jgi:transcriptional regulator with XRE-family HTH domain
MARRKERNFGLVVRERRRQRELTQQEVARRIRTSTAYIGHLESGRRHPSEEVVRRLAQVLGSISAIFTCWPISGRLRF